MTPRNGGRVPSCAPVQVVGTDRRAQIDASFHTDQKGQDLVLVSHFHEDHVVGLKRATGEVWVHEADVDAVRNAAEYTARMGLPADQITFFEEHFAWAALPDASAFTYGHVFDLGGGVTITAVHLPGHTSGHCGFRIMPDDVFFTGDIDMASFGLLYSDVDVTIAQVRSSLRRCAQVEARVYITAHHKGPYFDRSEFLAELTAFSAVVDRREARVLELLGQGHGTAEDMVGHNVLYRPGKRPPFADAMEAGTAQRHLDDLMERGVVGVNSEGVYSLK